jgi:NADH-quinone oxidoreductase subunit E
VSARQFQKVNEIIDRNGNDVSRLIAILQEIQAEYRYLPEEVLAYVATALGISPATVYGVATFYAQFSLKAKGHYVIKVCEGTACHVRGSEKLKYRLEERLGLGKGKDTTDDLQITLESVSCLGACGLAPVMTINDTEVHGQMTPEALEILIDQLVKRATTTDAGTASTAAKEA